MFNRAGEWSDSQPAEINTWLEKLTNPKVHENTIELPAAVQAQLARAALSKTTEYKNIEHLNELSYVTQAKLASDENRVNIVIPIYGAFHLVKKCIESVLTNTYWPYDLTLVDDASKDTEMTAWLEALVSRSDLCKQLHPNLKDITLLTNKKNKGFAATCNKGIYATSGRYLCVLNSDVLVTPYWLTKMVTAIEADPSHVMVNPVTNNTALINVPMEPGRSYMDMNRILERKSPKNYPEIMPTGFCLFFKRELVDKIGGFDEAYVSYGEDTHFWFQSLKLTTDTGEYVGNKAVMADDCYIFHERSSSFSQVGKDEHMALRRSGSERFHALNPSFADWKNAYNLEKILAPLRAETPQELYKHDYIYNVAWVVKSAAFCGGMKYITDIANELIERNVNVKICVIKNSPEASETVLSELHTAPIFFKDEEDFVANFSLKCFTNGVVIAAVNELVNPVGVLCTSNRHLTPIHHVQSYDPQLTGDPKLAQAMSDLYGKLKYTVSSSQWITDKLVKDHKLTNVLFTVKPGVDTDLFHTGSRSAGDDRFTVMVNIDPQYPFKGATRGAQLCQELVKNKNLRVFALGVEFLPEVPQAIGLGKVAQSRLAKLLRSEVDVFVDPAYIHSYGMPSLEALASGAEIVCWNNQGVLEYANNRNAGVHIFTPESTVDALATHIASMEKTPPDVIIPSRAESVETFIDQFEVNLGLRPFRKRITVITPHARKHGGPTTIINLANVLSYLGHDVKLVSIYDDFNNEVIGFKHVPLYVGIDNIKESDLVIINSDNPFTEEILHQPALKNAKRILLKLSHNPRFKAIEEASLRMPVWDKIITSTEHLRQKTIEPIENWRHIAWAPEKVQTVGWYHYTFPIFNTPPETREYGNIGEQIRIGYLLHDHPTKGTTFANAIVRELKRTYGANVDIIAVGESKLANKPPWLTYIYRPTRSEMAQVMKQCDIWLGASTSEGLGRMTLEAMASGCAVVTTDTGAEFLDNGENCMLYPVGEIQAGKLAVESVISDASLLKKLIVNGYKTAVKAAEPHTYVHNIRNIVYEVCKD